MVRRRPWRREWSPSPTVPMPLVHFGARLRYAVWPRSTRPPGGSGGSLPLANHQAAYGETSYFARHAEDLTVMFSTLTGAVRSTSTGQLRVGLLDHDPEFGMALHPACAAGVHIAGGQLESLGHDVEMAWPEALNHLWAPLTSNLGIIVDAARAPAIRWVSERLGRPVERDELDIEVFEAADRDAGRGRDEVEAAQRAMEGAVSPITTWWDEYDLLATPATFQPAWPLGGDPGPREMGTFLPPFSFTGQPALSLPLHETEDGLPVGVQLVGRRSSDEVLLRLAEELQVAVDWSVRRPRTN